MVVARVLRVHPTGEKCNLCKSPLRNRLTSCFLGETPPGRREAPAGGRAARGPLSSQSSLVRVPLLLAPRVYFPGRTSGLPRLLTASVHRAGGALSLAGSLGQRVGLGGPWEQGRVLPRAHISYLPLSALITAGLAGVYRPQASLPGGLKPDLIKM